MHLLLPHLEDDDPGIADVVKVDGPLVWITVTRTATGVVLVPVHAEPITAGAAVYQRFWSEAQSLPVQHVVLVEAAGAATLPPGRHVLARHDAVVQCQRADEGPLVILVQLVVWLGQRDARRTG